MNRNIEVLERKLELLRAQAHAEDKDFMLAISYLKEANEVEQQLREANLIKMVMEESC